MAENNMTVVREALVAIQKLVQANIAADEFDDLEPLKEYVQIRDICNAALSAPPRNCDIAQDWLRDLYVKFKPPASVKREMPPEWVDAVMAFCRWLVAPATEKDGGAK